MICKNRKFIFGVGTGRCGSVSLSILLNEQAGAAVSHEMSGHILPWKYNESLLDVLLTALKRRGCEFVGDVASFYLPYVGGIIERFPDSKFVCLKRDKELCVASLMAKHGQFNMFQDGVSPPNIWQSAAPTFPNTMTRKEATEAYYDLYYGMALALESRNPDRFKIFDTECLNTAAGVKSILDFCGFVEPDVIVGLRTNAILNGDVSR